MLFARIYSSSATCFAATAAAAAADISQSRADDGDSVYNQDQ